MEVYERIRQLRKEILKLSQTDFGNRLGVNRDVINNIENNRLARPDQKLSLIKLMCKEFGVNEQWLLTGEGDPFPEKSRHDEITDFVNSLAIDDNSFKSRFIAALSRMSEEEWLLVEKVVKQVAADTVAPAQIEPTAEELEEEYKKIHYSDATEQEGTSSASNITAGTDQTA